jgi:NAD+ synthase (glutamine-hydrolysing)
MLPEEMYQNCVNATKEFVAHAGFEEVVIGLSGGIDSSLVAAIAVDALGPQNVHGLLLPGPYSSDHSVSDAQELADNLGISTQTISIVEPYEAFAHAYAAATGEALGGLAAENTQARCRMVCIMAMSNAKGYMMLNTGNKSEACMGYSTLYGDTAGAFAPIGGVYKTQVYEMANAKNRAAKAQGGAAVIPQHVLVKPPSAELSPNQSDEASMGVAYDVLDKILIELVEHGKSVDEVAACGFARAQVLGIANRYASYSFKRAVEPPFPSVRFYE